MENERNANLLPERFARPPVDVPRHEREERAEEEALDVRRSARRLSDGSSSTHPVEDVILAGEEALGLLDQSGQQRKEVKRGERERTPINPQITDALKKISGFRPSHC